MKKNLTKLEQLKADHKKYNLQFVADKRLQMKFEEYVAWVNGTGKMKRKWSPAQPKISKPSWAVTTDHIPSIMGTSQAKLSKTSMVEKAKMGLVDADSAIDIISKSKRIGIAYSKGSYQYITEGTDLKTLGKKSQSL